MNKSVVLAVLSALMLSACGGGSSGSSSPTPTPTPDPTPAPAPAPTPVPTDAVFADAPEAYGALAVASFDSLLQLGFLTTNLVTQDKPSAHGIERPCQNGGIIQADYSMPDVADLQTGEVISITLQECERGEVSDIISGTLVLEIMSVDDAKETYQVQADFSDTEIGSSEALALSGRLNVQLDSVPESNTIQVKTAEPLTLEGDDGLSFTLNDVLLSHTRNKRTAKYSLVGNGKVTESNAIGTFTFTIDEPFVGYFSEYPHEGSMTLSSDASEDLIVAANFVENSGYLDLMLDGDTFLLAWWDVVEGAIWSFNGTAMNYAQSFRSDNFSAIGLHAGDVNNFPLMGSVEFYFSRPVDSIEGDYLRFEAWDWGYSSVNAEVEINGAVVTLTPSRPLKAGVEYYVTDFIAYSAAGQSDWSNSVYVMTSTDATATISVSGDFIKATDTPTLSVAAEFANGDDIAQVNWLDTDDVGVRFVSQGDAEVTLDLSNVDSETRDFQVTAEITSTRGLVAYAATTLTILPESDYILAYASETGDYIGGGQNRGYSEADGDFRATISEAGNYIAFNFEGSDYWGLDLASAEDAQLAVGVYENATRWPFQSPTMPGLNFSGAGRGCNNSYGEFEILELAVSGTDVERLAVDWTQHCEREDAPALRGSLRFNSDYPLN